MTTRRATCSCGQLQLSVEGEPSRIWICHCRECQRRTGAVFGNLARFRREQITFNGTATAWKRTGESGNALTCHFCPTCGSTVYFENEAFAGIVAVAIGNFADPNFPAPTNSVWEETRHPWVAASRHQASGEAGVIPLISAHAHRESAEETSDKRALNV
jgi:hypothetical protein